MVETLYVTSLHYYELFQKYLSIIKVTDKPELFPQGRREDAKNFRYEISNKKAL
jgi:hypothetical protein